jgi:hypothetical protein
MTEDPKQTQRNGSDPRTAQSRSAKAEGVLSSFCLDYLALQPTSSVNDVPVTRARYRLVDAQNAPFGAASMVMGTAHHNVPNGGSGASGAPTARHGV